MLGIVLINGEQGAVDTELINQHVRTADILEFRDSSLLQLRTKKSNEGGVTLQGIPKCVGSVFIGKFYTFSSGVAQSFISFLR